MHDNWSIRLGENRPERALKRLTVVLLGCARPKGPYIDPCTETFDGDHSFAMNMRVMSFLEMTVLIIEVLVEVYMHQCSAFCNYYYYLLLLVNHDDTSRYRY